MPVSKPVTLIAARRFAGARPHLAAVAGIVHREDLWRLCRDELTGVDVRADGWDIRGRWFGVVLVGTPRLERWGAASRHAGPRHALFTGLPNTYDHWT